MSTSIQDPRQVLAAATRPRGGSGGGDVLPFRRRQRRVRRRRRPLLRWLRPLAGALAIVGVPCWTAFWLLTAPRFALAEVRVESGERVSADWVRATTEPFRGHNLFRLPTAAVDARLAAHPWIAAVGLRKEPPATLEVIIAERRPRALLNAGGDLHYLDGEGRVIAPFDPPHGPPAQSADLLLISGAPALNEPATPASAATTARIEPAPATSRDPAAALRLAAELAAARADWHAALSEIEMLGGEDYRVFTAELPFPLLVRAGSIATRARHLETLLPGIVARYGDPAAVDLRFARRIIVQPFRGDRRAALTALASPRAMGTVREARTDHAQTG